MYLRLTKEQETMVIENIGMVKWLIKTYKTYIQSNRGILKIDDIIQEGVCGLIEAVKRFDPSYGKKFSTYAFWWIFRFIQLAIYHQSRLIRLPELIQKKLVKFSKQEFYDRNEMLKGFSEESGINLAVLLTPESLARPLRMSEKPLGDILPDKTEVKLEDKVIENIQEKTIIEALNLILNDRREIKIVLMRAGIGGYKPSTLEEIGKELRISKERVRQLLEGVKARPKIGYKGSEGIISRLAKSPIFVSRLSIPPTSSG
ncbi:hypothetical protein A3F08_01525 [Candidatus Berkelbacteria bacterium RIFCSPHIGHO2_12_FULL_36_9]|uniref:RNA polymerase sigma-70 domain-containing protein n=1 Tax=Candidatus Berkelbacteria bacterium RIFCSPHIGHO2_12_FULL_36_9 TaxID=1797469 RepID=A0A1F5EKB6_9BACT|nr:MAG: hypothetical protein A3F08_01525 [Candidatus Berkelbacteria bacterium RIFCSPHIGHO2_12_FULL_36_9]